MTTTDVRLVTSFQFAYMTRSPLHVREAFFDRLAENIKAMRLPRRLEEHFLAVGILAFGCKQPEKRRALCDRALNALDVLKPWKLEA